MKRFFLLATFATLLLASCETEEGVEIITLGDYPLKEYYLERDPKVNTWGAGIDFIHEETTLATTDLDYEYLLETDTFSSDLKFYIIKAYYENETGDIVSEGCPMVLLSSTTTGCKLGAGVSFFDSLTVITEDMTALLASDPVIDFEDFRDDSTGYYDRDLLYPAINTCLIGQSFRSNILVVPEGSTEEESQAVYLLKTEENAYVKFMIRQFKGDQPNEKQTLFRWQVISE